MEVGAGEGKGAVKSSGDILGNVDPVPGAAVAVLPLAAPGNAPSQAGVSDSLSPEAGIDGSVPSVGSSKNWVHISAKVGVSWPKPVGVPNVGVAGIPENNVVSMFKGTVGENPYRQLHAELQSRGGKRKAQI